MNRAVREHLRSVVETERGRTARFLVRLRALGAIVYLFVTAWLAVGQGLPDWRRSLPSFAVYAALAVAVAFLIEWAPALRRLTGLSIAVLDMPMVTLISLSVAPTMQRPEYLLGALVPLLLALVVLSALALDLVAIASCTVAALLGTAVLLHRLGAPASELLAPVVALGGTGAICMFLVSRLRAMVEESRRKDFAGKYVLGERIGAGGMAEVFVATYSPEGGFERRVAVKRVLPAYAGSEDFVAMFRREAELGAQLAHPNLVQVLDFGRHLESWFLAMEYVDGVSLAALLRALSRRGERLPLAAGLYVLGEVAEGLAYLHEKRSQGGDVGLVHRDLNPPNVLVSRLGEVKVSDFGIARWRGVPGLTKAGTVRGKVAYMAPEQLEGGSPTPGWDLFALGVTAHELLTGRALFAAEDETMLGLKVLEAEVAPPSAQRPELSPAVDALVLGLLERDPARRLPAARLVVQRLRALEGQDAPWPSGQLRLAEAVASAGPAPAAQAPAELADAEAADASTVHELGRTRLDR